MKNQISEISLFSVYNENLTYCRVRRWRRTLSPDALASIGKARVVAVLYLFEELQQTEL